MKGTVLGFDPDTNTGAISGYDGERYDFITLDWRGGGRPARGTTVDFVADATRARQIYPVGAPFDAAEGTLANTVYILYLASLLVGVTGIVGLIMAYVNRSDAAEWVRTHYRFQIRTFWIGLLYGLIGVATAFIVIGFLWLGFVLVWWVVRCAKGIRAISRGLPCDRPATWLW